MAAEAATRAAIKMDRIITTTMLLWMFIKHFVCLLRQGAHRQKTGERPPEDVAAPISKGAADYANFGTAGSSGEGAVKVAPEVLQEQYRRDRVVFNNVEWEAWQAIIMIYSMFNLHTADGVMTHCAFVICWAVSRTMHTVGFAIMKNFLMRAVGIILSNISTLACIGLTFYELHKLEVDDA